MALPATEEESPRFAFSVRNRGKLKGYAWVWMERLAPKKPRVPNPAVLAVRVANLAEREQLLSADPAKFFTEPHYEGFPAVLVRLAAVSIADLKVLLLEAWRCQAPVDLIRSIGTGSVAGSTRPKSNKAKKAKKRKS